MGLYQHDVKAKHLRNLAGRRGRIVRELRGRGRQYGQPRAVALRFRAEPATARRVYEYRREHGPFRSREQLREVPGFGEATFIQAAGFLKIAGGDNPLDATWIHPESYAVAARVLERFGGKPADLTEKEAAAALAQRMAACEPGRTGEGRCGWHAGRSRGEPACGRGPGEQAPAIETPVPVSAVEVGKRGVPPAPASEVVAPALASEVMHATPASEAPVGANSAEISTEVGCGRRAARRGTSSPPGHKEPSVGTLTLRDILAQLARPGRDPREDLPPPVFKQGVLKLEDLTAGMELTGTVLNVVDFGCFVDIGMHDSGLVHVSRLADRFIRDPHEVVAVGDIVKVWVMEVDKERRRVSLTMVRPGSERARRPARGEGGAFRTGSGRPEQGSGKGRPGSRRAAGRSSHRAAARGGGVDAPTGQQSQQGGQVNRQDRKAGVRKAADRRAAGRKAAGPTRRPAQHGGVLRSKAARRRAKAAPAASPRRGPSRKLWRSSAAKTAAARSRPGPPNEFKPKPKPLIPITDAMKKGKEPMRTFGDLMQFFEAKTDDKKPPAAKKKEQGESRARPAARCISCRRSDRVGKPPRHVDGRTSLTPNLAIAIRPASCRLNRRSRPG